MKWLGHVFKVLGRVFGFVRDVERVADAVEDVAIPLSRQLSPKDVREQQKPLRVRK